MNEHIATGLNNSVWKYTINVHSDLDPGTDQAIMALPKGAQIVHVAPFTNGDEVTFWALIDLHNQDDPEPRTFRLAGTGHRVPQGLTYLGTTATPGPTNQRPGTVGMLVWHLFEVPIQEV